MKSAIHEFLAGNSVPPSKPLDMLIWLNFGGHEKAIVKGKPPEAMIQRLQPPNSLEKYLTRHLSYVFREDIRRSKVEELYIRFTNHLTPEDAEIIYQATEGKLPVDPKFAEEYAKDRRFENGLLIFPEKVIEKSEEKSETSAGSDGKSVEGEVEKTEKKPSRRAPKAAKAPAKVQKDA